MSKKNKDQQKVDASSFYNKNGKITVTAFDFFSPITVLYSQLFRCPAQTGFSHSIIVISVMMVESIINRVKYDENKISISNSNFFKDYCQSSQLDKVFDDYSEILLIRNIIAHNHIWFIEFDDEYNEKSYELLMGNKDFLFNKYVNIKSYRTLCNNINIIPDKIDIEDVNKILIIVNNLMEKIFEIEKQKGRLGLDPSIRKIKYDGYLYSFREFLSLFKLIY